MQQDKIKSKRSQTRDTKKRNAQTRHAKYRSDKQNGIIITSAACKSQMECYTGAEPHSKSEKLAIIVLYLFNQDRHPFLFSLGLQKLAACSLSAGRVN